MIGDRALAEQYMMTRLEEQPVITAPELRAAFQERKAEFTEPEQVKWQQIQISLRNYENDSDAEQAAKEALAALQKGTPFDDVAKEYSDGPDAANGGHWDWTQPESLPAELKETLQTLPPGKPSGLIRTETNLQIVRIVERKDERVRPFEEVQDQIRKDLRSQSQQDRAKKIVDELKASAVIETMFDSPTITASATPAEETPSPPRFSTISRQGS
jgi:parvulin-like peptidyl-prolyl isomerase